MEAELFKMLEPLGLPGAIIGGLYLIYRIAPDRKTQEPAAQVVDALNALRAELTAKIDGLGDDLVEMRVETVQRLASVETEVKNLKERK
jgi:hypothetical protein